MRKILSFCLLVCILSTVITPVFAITNPDRTLPMESAPIVYPTGEDFSKLKTLIETNFSPSSGGYRYDCIANSTLCPNYKYTSVIEKAIKLIVLRTYTGNEAFYDTLFKKTSSYNYDFDIGKRNPLKNILDSIPHGSTISDWKSLGFGNSIGGELLDASFGVDFTENMNSSTMLVAIEQKIKDMKGRKCSSGIGIRDSMNGADNCYSSDLSNIYLPTQEELYAETIYLNRGSVKIGTLKDEIEYNVQKTIETQNISDISGNIITQYVPVMSYTLRYKKDTFTLEEAKIELEKKDVSNEEFIMTYFNDNGVLPCKKYTTYLAQSQCTAARASLKEIQTALAAYSIDNGGPFPDNLVPIKKTYLVKFPQAFTDNFSYKGTKNSRGEPDFEIRYIGHIGENTIGSGETTDIKDYKAMMSGATVPEIPAIFSHIPADSMALYVRNPANLIDLLNQKSNTSQRLSGIDASESIRNLMKTFFELEKFEQIEKNLKHDMAIVVNNLDATAPDIVIILSESDRDALSPTGKARVVGSKDGYIFIASSKESLEKLTNLTVEKSMSKAPDFQYVWWKKSALVKDALMFVGDEFFAKMLTLETYITHYRKYRDYSRLASLQELAWAYTDAFGKMPIGFAELSGLGLSTLTGEVLGEYSIVDGIVTHRNIGSLNSLKTLPEARYDLSKISRTEFEDYKYNVLQYRDIWRSSLDPMGIVINRYGDGMEVDFFMTPIPSSPDQDLMQIQKMFEGTTKDSLSFVINPQIRMGLVSFVLGFDPQKLQSKIKSNEEIDRGFEEFSKEILDGKNIFDYLGGEFAWSLGNLDPDIFEGWNVEKVDAYISVQVANETKGKELIEMLKKKFIGEMNRGGSSTESSMFSMLAKPLIEDYKGKKIYYIEAIPVPWVGKIGLAYTFVDDFFIIGLNRSTIRHVIDTAVSGDIDKKNLISTESFEKGTFFATLFDGVRSSTELKKLYEKNQSTIPRYFGDIFRSESTMTPLIASYYATEDRSRRLGKKPVSFYYELGSLSLSGMGDNLIVKIDQNKLSNLSGTTLEMWESIRKDSTFPLAIFADQGIPLESFLTYPRIGDIISINMLVQLDSALGGTESLLRNVTFGMNMGDDEIGFRLRVFRQKEGSKGVSPIGTSSDMMMIGGVVILLIVLGGVVWFIIRRRPSSSIAVAPSMPNTDRTVTESPVIISSLILPQDTIPVTVVTPMPSVDTIPPITAPIIQAPVSTPVVEMPLVPVIEPVASSTSETISLPQEKSLETK